MTPKKIELLASDLLDKYRLKEIPIKIEKVADKMGLKILEFDLGENVSGVLVIEDSISIIGVNPNDSSQRKRFTIAHELGHYQLHRDISNLFVDKEYKVMFRNGESSNGENVREMQANSFAASVLMPKELVLQALEEHDYDLTDDVIKKLAADFQVSISAMTYRLANLDIFKFA